MDLFLELLSFDSCYSSDVTLLFLTQTTMTLTCIGHNLNFKNCNCTYIWEDIFIKMDLQEVRFGVWTSSSWLRIGTGGGLLFNAV